MFVKEILLQTDDVLALVVVDQVHRLNKKEHSILKVARLSIQFLLGKILVRFWLQYGSGSMIFMDLLIDKDPHQKLPENKRKIQTKLTYKCKISLHSFYSTYLVNIFLKFEKKRIACFSPKTFYLTTVKLMSCLKKRVC